MKRQAEMNVELASFKSRRTLSSYLLSVNQFSVPFNVPVQESPSFKVVVFK